MYVGAKKVTKVQTELIRRIWRTRHGAILYTELDPPTKRVATRMVGMGILRMHGHTLYLSNLVKEKIEADRNIVIAFARNL
jgi:hypothetical protein